MTPPPLTFEDIARTQHWTPEQQIVILLDYIRHDLGDELLDEHAAYVAAATVNRCPACGAPLLRVTDGSVGVIYAPGYLVRGDAVPTRMERRPFDACMRCDHCVEIGRTPRRKGVTP